MSSSTQTSRIILITGCSSGFGRAFAQYFLEQGQKVVVTARKIDTIQHFAEKYPSNALVLSLDVNNQDSVNAAVAKTIQKFDRIDVLINNAGYCLYGLLETHSEEEYRLQMETNFFGAVRMTQAVLPVMRKQRSGHVLQISSVGGIVASPMISLYNASKFALEGFTEALAKETAAFNVRFTIVEPGGFLTDITTEKNMLGGVPQDVDVSADYAKVIEGVQMFLAYLKNAPGDTNKAAAAIYQIIQSNNPPLRLPLGADSVHLIKTKLAEQLKEIEAWEQLSVSTNFNHLNKN